MREDIENLISSVQECINDLDDYSEMPNLGVAHNYLLISKMYLELYIKDLDRQEANL